MKKYLDRIKEGGGQAVVGVVLISSLLTTTVGWIATKLLNSPAQLSASLNAVETEVAVLKKSDEVQDGTISEIKSNVEYIRRSVEEQNRRWGIIVPDITKK